MWILSMSWVGMAHRLQVWSCMADWTDTFRSGGVTSWSLFPGPVVKPTTPNPTSLQKRINYSQHQITHTCLHYSVLSMACSFKWCSPQSISSYEKFHKEISKIERNVGNFKFSSIWWATIYSFKFWSEIELLSV